MDNNDRKNVCDIFSEMFDNEDEHGIYPTSIAYAKVIQLIQDARFEAVGWASVDGCDDKGNMCPEARKKNFGTMAERAKADLGYEEDLHLITDD